MKCHIYAKSKDINEKQLYLCKYIGYERKEYLDKIIDYTGNRLIKVLVGQRRAGKSYILRQVAKKADRIIYLQATYMLIDQETVKREYAPLKAIDDNYKKVVVSLDDIPMPLNEGIRHIQAWNLKEILQK